MLRWHRATASLKVPLVGPYLRKHRARNVPDVTVGRKFIQGGLQSLKFDYLDVSQTLGSS